MLIFPLVVGQLQTNCFLISDEVTYQSVVVDPGDDAGLILQKVQDEQLKPEAIITTHGHFDHIMAGLELQLTLQIPFLVHRQDEFLVKRLRQTARHFVGTDPGPAPKINGFLDSAKSLKIGKIRLQIIETPGHTPGGVSFYSLKEKVIFVGDTFFADGSVGRTDYSYANPKDLQASLDKLLKLPGKTVVYPGHGPKTTIAQERFFHQNMR